MFTYLCVFYDLLIVIVLNINYIKNIYLSKLYFVSVIEVEERIRYCDGLVFIRLVERL